LAAGGDLRLLVRGDLARAVPDRRGALRRNWRCWPISSTPC